MTYSEFRPKTYTLLFHCPCCEGCMKILKKIKGVETPLDVDVYANKVTISATGDIQLIISELKRKKAMFSKLLPDEKDEHEDEPAELQMVPVKNPVQKATYQQTEFIGVIVKAPKLIAEKAYDGYSTTHEHDFELKTYDKRFSCNVCREDGYGTRYRCNGDCAYELHEECKNPKITITHDLFKEFKFELRDRLHSADPCISCGKSVCGRFYHCEENGFNLHPRCANLEAKIHDSGNSFVLRRKSSNSCLWCKKKEVEGAKSWSYESSADASCCFHVHCVTEMVQEAWKRSGVRHEDDVSMALASVGARNKVVSKNRKKGNYSGFMKIASILLKVVIAILLGDPAALLVATVVELLK